MCVALCKHWANNGKKYKNEYCDKLFLDQNIHGQGITRHDRLIRRFLPEKDRPMIWLDFLVSMACNFSQLRRRQSSGSLHKAKTDEDFKDQFYRSVSQLWREKYLLAGDNICHFQRLRSRSRSIGKYEGGSARLQKIRQVRRRNEKVLKPLTSDSD